jgi:hypothetical protein
MVNAAVSSGPRGPVRHSDPRNGEEPINQVPKSPANGFVVKRERRVA